MKRNRRKCSQKVSVETAVFVLEKKVHPKFNSKKFLIRLKIQEAKGSKYYRLFLRISEYLDELRGYSINTTESVLVDYYTCIFRYFEGFDRIPTLLNLSPSIGNKIRFEEWINNYERRYQEKYWMTKYPVEQEITEVPIEPLEFEPSISEV